MDKDKAYARYGEAAHMEFMLVCLMEDVEQAVEGMDLPAIDGMKERAATIAREARGGFPEIARHADEVVRIAVNVARDVLEGESDYAVGKLDIAARREALQALGIACLAAHRALDGAPDPAGEGADGD